MKKLAVSVLLSLVGMSFVANAGVKEAGGDTSALFTCVSAPYVDSDVKIFGMNQQLGSGVDLLIFVNGNLVAQDVGLISEGYVGQLFDIKFGEEEYFPATIKAKADNGLLSKEASDTIFCTWAK